MPEFRLPTITSSSSKTDSNDSDHSLGDKRLSDAISNIKFGFKDVLEPAKKQQKKMQEAFEQEDREIYHQFLLMSQNEQICNHSQATSNEEIK